MSAYGDEPVDVHAFHWPKARKQHECDACHETIRVGDKYVTETMLFDGAWETVKRCLRCEAIRKHLAKRMRGGDEGESPHWTLGCGHTYRERWGEDPPPEIAALAFALPGEVTT